MRAVLVQIPARDGKSQPMVLSPLGLAYVGAAARKAGHEVVILDAVAENREWQDFTDRVLAEKPDVVGITGTTALRDVVRRAVRLLRPHVRWLITLEGQMPPLALKRFLASFLRLIMSWRGRRKNHLLNCLEH